MAALAYRLRITLVAITAALVASLGVTATTGSALAATKHHRAHHVIHHRSHHKSGNCIPQNGGGDNDADNHGGPSDGDGCV
jgi:hypothetical protein